MNDVRMKLLNAIDEMADNGFKPQILVVAVKTPTGGIEAITNHGENIQDKLSYYHNAYDEEMNLKANSSIKIVDLMIV